MATINLESDEEIFEPSDFDFKTWAQKCLNETKENVEVSDESCDEGFDAIFNDTPKKAHKQRKQDELDTKCDRKTHKQRTEDVVELISDDEDCASTYHLKRTRSQTNRKAVQDASEQTNQTTQSKTTRRKKGRTGQQDNIHCTSSALDTIVLSDTEEDVIDTDLNVITTIISDDEDVIATVSDDDLSKQSEFDCEQENREVKVKVWWQLLEMHCFRIRKHQKLESVFEHFSKLAGVSVDKIVLTVRDSNFIKPTDTPASLNLTIADIIEGFVLSKVTNSVPETQDSSAGKELLEFKLLIKERKKPLLLKIGKDETLGILMIKCAEEIGIPVKKLKLIFDGDSVEPTATPSDLDMEGGECLDVRIID